MLQAFVASAKAGNFARAAMDLNLTASAISHQIAKLEEWWNVKLFERHSRGVDLTAEGKTLHPLVATFFEELDSQLQSLGCLAPAELNVICTSSLCSNWLGPRLLHYDCEEAFPDVTLRSGEITSENLSAIDFDVAIVIGHGVYPGHNVNFLMRDQVFPICAPSLLDGRAEFGLDELHHHPIIRRTDDPLCPGWADWCDYNRLEIEPYQGGLCFPDSSLTIGLAARGGGIALGRTALVYDHLVQGTLVQASSGVMPSPTAYYSICKSERQNEPRIQTFSKWLRREASSFAQEVYDSFPTVAFSIEDYRIS